MPTHSSSSNGHEETPPSPWILRFAERVARDGEVLDLACGGGRHSRLFLDRGCRVLAVDRDVARVAAALGGTPGLEILETDLEAGRDRGTDRPWGERRFAAVVVVNYLHRPLLAGLVDSVAPEGLLLYETFAQGNERFGRPRNPDYLLRSGELLEVVRGRLRVLAYEDLEVGDPRPAVVQRIAALRKP